MSTNTALLDAPKRHAAASPLKKVTRTPEPLLRAALGEALRAHRAEQHVTLRTLAQLAKVSPGYISELERGRKEVSSEVLAAICAALGTTVADVLIEAASAMAVSGVSHELENVSNGSLARNSMGVDIRAVRMAAAH
ncbi:helix-turn-helix domain-containing protein [Corynebacterium caspium]|uniref:helix-turn-helix domain-containing protein n=1 Tax=Corynebacterium caspium TaxID=234828 RepID=UPI0009FC9C52|nr:helix-turn-helix transcriptional regulator [Corynebacterium caspium]WKD59107.1 Transcriptional regulator ClgR [Corynebacterium caspium DSM 44850]